MGAEQCGCKKPTIHDSQTNMFRPTGIQASWMDAIHKNTIAGVQALHSTDVELIDQPIDRYNYCAIHYVIKHKQYEILDYFLSQQFDINVQETKTGNTALHLAAANMDTKAIEKLFSYDDIDDKIKNYEGFEACHMVPHQYKREYIKTKERGKAIGNKLKKERKTKDGFGGNIYNLTDSRREVFEKGDINYLSLNNGYNENANSLNGKYRMKGICLTKFALEIGVDIDEMGMYLQRSVNKGIWDKLTHEKEIIKKDKDIEKILNGICILTMKDKKKHQNKATNNDISHGERPTKEAIQQLTKRMGDILRRSNDGKIKLNKTEFNKNFHNYLYDIHHQIINRKISE